MLKSPDEATEALASCRADTIIPCHITM